MKIILKIRIFKTSGEDGKNTFCQQKMTKNFPEMKKYINISVKLEKIKNIKLLKSGEKKNWLPKKGQ